MRRTGFSKFAAGPARHPQETRRDFPRSGPTRSRANTKPSRKANAARNGSRAIKFACSCICSLVSASTGCRRLPRTLCRNIRCDDSRAKSPANPIPPPMATVSKPHHVSDTARITAVDGKRCACRVSMQTVLKPLSDAPRFGEEVE
jgi:hypothetical protein